MKTITSNTYLKIVSRENADGSYTFKAVILEDETNEISRCNILVNQGTWKISSWYTNEGYKGQGLGKKCMRELIQYIYLKMGKPEYVEYIWNGQNEYVYQWMERHFNPISKCPIAVQKYDMSDSWDSHIYKLNVDSFLNYFKVA